MIKAVLTTMAVAIMFVAGYFYSSEKIIPTAALSIQASPIAVAPSTPRSDLSTIPRPATHVQVERKPTEVQAAQPKPYFESIPIAGAHGALIASSSADQLTPHQIMEHEQKDTTWAWDGEQKISNYLSNNPWSQAFEINSVACRTSMCEIQAYAPGSDSPEKWKNVLDGIRADPWWRATFESAFTVTSTGSDGRLIILTYFEKTAPTAK